MQLGGQLGGQKKDIKQQIKNPKGKIKAQKTGKT